MSFKIRHSRLTIHNLLLLLLLLIYVFLALGHAYLAPLTTGPDELAHYEYVRFIADHGRLPLDYEERAQASYKSDQPPLYHLLTALPASLVDPSGPPLLKRYSDHLRRQLIERTRHAWGLYNTEDELWPYRGEVLRWQVGRWVAILFGAATVAVTYVIARGLFADGWPALGAAGVVAFTPRFLLTGSMLNYETTLAFFAALFLGVLLRMARQGSRVASGRWQGGRLTSSKDHASGITHHASRITFHAILLGLFLGLALTTKLSALILPLETLLALWLIKRHWGRSWGWWLRTAAITAGAALAAVSWWFGFILYQFNTVATDGLWAGLLRPLIAADASDATTNRLLNFLTGGQAGFAGAIDNLEPGPPWRWAAIFFRTFWTVGIEGQQPWGWVGLALALLVCVAAGYGLALAWRNDRRSIRHSRRSQDRPPTADRRIGTFPENSRLILSLLLLHLAAAFVLPLARYIATASLADTAQGRHVLFLTAPAFAILLVWGLREAVASGRWQVASKSYTVLRLVPLIPGVFLLFWSGAQLWTMSWAYLPLLPVRTVPEAKAQAAHLLEQPLNEYVTLVGYDQGIEENGLLRVELIWQGMAVSPVDFLTEVSLVDDQGEWQAQWLGYPAGGRYPTRAWDVGDIVRDTVWLPAAGAEAGEYQLKLGLIRAGTLPPESPASSLAEQPFVLDTVKLPALPSPLAQAGIEIWQDGQRVTTPRIFGYRETILVTLPPALDNESQQVQIVGPGPEGSLAFDPIRKLGRTALFIVGPDWATGEYRVQVPPGQNGEGQFTSEPLIRVIDRWERQFEPPPVSRPVEANFANQVKLLGYDLAAKRAEPGGAIPLTLYWQGLAWMGEDYTVFTKLLAADGSSHGGRDRRPQEGYSTLYWAPGEIVVDPFGAPVAEDAPDGIYYLNVGLYKEVNGQAVSLPLVQDGQPIEAASVNIGPVKIGETPPEWVLETADPARALDQPFGEPPNLTLLGYDLAEESARLKLTLYWRVEAPLAVDYTTFVHLRNEAGETVAQQDQPPLGGDYPTSLWEAGEIIADEISLSLPPDLPAGEYSLVVGLYDFRTGARLSVPGQPENSVPLTTMRISS